jgi:hypothetical protein
MADVVSLSDRLIRTEIKIDNLDTGISELKTLVIQTNEQNEEKYASKATENIVYGMVGVILFTVLVSLLATVILNKKP